MPYIKQISIQNLLEDTVLSDVVSNYVELKKNGANYICACPFHNEKSASFTVSNSKNMYKCFGCGEGGNNPISFIMAKEDLDYLPAVRKLASLQNFTLEEEEYSPEQAKAAAKTKKIVASSHKLLDRANQLFIEQAKKFKGFKKEVVGKRKLSEETISDFSIGYAPENIKFLSKPFADKKMEQNGIDAGLIKKTPKGIFDYFINRITFPIYNAQGQILSFGGQNVAENDYAKYINGPDTEVYDKSKVLFGLQLAKEAIKKQGFAIITEGYYDVISAHDKKLNNTVGTCGTAFTKQQAKLLKRYTNSLTFAFDGDKAGTKATIKAIKIAIEQGFTTKVLQMPEDLDLDDYCRTPEIENENHNYQDAIIWYSNHLVNLYSDKGPAGKQWMADKTIEILSLITQEIKRNSYIKLIAKIIGVPQTSLKKPINETIIEEAVKQQAKQAKKYSKSKFGEGVNTELATNTGFYEKDNEMFVIQGDGKPTSVSNFTMKIILHIKAGVEDKAKRLIAVKNVFNENVQIIVDTDDMVSVGPFKKVLENAGRYLFKGNDRDLMIIKENLMIEEKPSTPIEVLGWQKAIKAFAFSNGIIETSKENISFQEIDENGIVLSEKKNLLIPYLTADNSDNAKFKKFKDFKFDTESTVTLKEWMDQFIVVFGDEGIITLLFAFATIYLDVSVKHLERFPMLNLFGKRGSGKGTIAEQILALFTKNPVKLNLEAKSTNVGSVRSLQQFANVPIWFDEYKNGKTDGTLKAIYDRDTRVMGTKSNSIYTKSPEIVGAAIVSGQDLPNSESALLSRFFLLQFFVSSRSPKQKREFLKLNEIRNRGLTHLVLDIVKHRKLIEKDFKDLHIANTNEIDKEINQEIEDRYLTNYSILLTIFDILQEQIKFPFDRTKLMSIICKNIVTQIKIDQGTDDVSKFWKEIEIMYIQGELVEERHFKIQDGMLFLSMGVTISIYTERMNKQRDLSFITGETLRSYLKTDKRFKKESKKSFTDGNRHNCYAFTYNLLGIDLVKLPSPADGEDIDATTKTWENKTGIELTKKEEAPF